MKTIVLTLSAAVLMAAAVTNAVAVECAEGARHAGCVGERGAAVVHKPAVVETPKAVVETPKAVVVPKKEVVVDPAVKKCTHVDGRTVCR